MLAAVLRVPAPIPPLLPAAPARPLLRRSTTCRLPAAPMASAEAGATKPDAAPAPAPQPQPQPPEKPLPGDCCGSGCVRCVWDIYYDELDAYDKALASTPPSSGSGGQAPADIKPSDGARS